MYNLSKLDPSYRLKIHRFIDAAKRHACKENMKHIYCPCIDCKNIDVFDDIEEIILIWFVEFFYCSVQENQLRCVPLSKLNGQRILQFLLVHSRISTLCFWQICFYPVRSWRLAAPFVSCSCSCCPFHLCRYLPLYAFI